MPSGNQTSTSTYQQVDTNNEIDLSLCNAFDTTVQNFKYLIDYVHNTQPVLRIISSLLYMPDYECWLDSNCQMNEITLRQDDLKGRMYWLALNTTSTHTYIVMGSFG